MEVIRLEFQGIGPFTDHHVIDFRSIGQSGLFLLEGPTGSGKTTILDAIVFALYGDVAGADSSRGRIVSTLLAPGCEPFVDLVIDSSRGLLRVRRTPEYERAKLRGQGTTTSKASVRLWKLSSPDDPEGAPLSSNIAEASDELQQAIGLTKAQFTQTVMLPQGQFATFLRAKPEERRDVLQDIFGTDLYDRFARELHEQAQEHRSRTERARDAVSDVAASFCHVAWYDEAAVAIEMIPEQVAFDQAVDALDLDAVREGARRRLTALGEQLAAARRDADAAQSRHAGAAETLRALEARNALIAELTTLQGRRAVLAGNEASVLKKEAALAAAERAEHARRPIGRREQAAEDLTDARDELDAAVAGVRKGSDGDLVEVLSIEGLSIEAVRACEDAARLAAGQLDRVVALENGLVGRRKAARREREELDVERGRIDDARLRIQEALDEAVTLEKQVVARDEVAATLASAVEEQGTAEGRRDAAREVARVTTRLTRARTAEHGADKALQEADSRHAEARAAWLGSIAGELAAELVVGEPCAVCGSSAHPHPAVRAAGAVGRDEVERLAAALQEASRKAAAARTTCDQLAEQLEERTPLAEGLTVADAEAMVAAAVTTREAAQQAVRDAAELRKRIDSLRQAAQEAERPLQQDSEALVARIATLQVTDRQIAADQAEVAAEAGDDGSVRDRQRALTARADAAHRLAILLTQVTAAEAELTRCASELEAVLAERDFATADEARAALLEESERARLRDAATAHREEVAGVAAQLASERFAGLAGAALEDPEPARLAEEQAAAAVHEAHRLTGAIETTNKAAAAASQDLSERIAAFAKLHAEAGPLLRMANLANAAEGNLQRVTLPTYVLLRRFEEVVDLANVRLDQMTGGRYDLRRTDDREGRSQKLGLGLQVVDHQAHDTARDPKTLSGGETFMASLSLALGLADAVTAEAGGIQLHTLFVDEGFGSLDPETLDAVMQQLSALRAGGRSVGVVSHVDEMKRRIPERITVLPRRDGTSTLRCGS